MPIVNAEHSMSKQKLVISPVGGLFIGLLISLVGLVTMLTLGESSIANACLVTLFIFESWMWLISNRRITPNILFTIGWYLPVLISLIPIQNLIYSEKPLQYEAFVGILLVSVMFYFVSIVLRLCFKPRNTGTSEFLFKKSQYPLFVIVVLFLISNAGFVIASLNARLAFPLFQGDITRAASEYFGVRGSSTMFSMGLVASLLLLMRAIKISHVSMIRQPKGVELYVYVFFFFYIIELLLGGKRMDLVVVIVSCLAALGRVYGIRKRNLVYAVIVVALVILGNGYLRGRFDFNQYWKGKSFNAVQSMAMYSMVQPVLYTRQAFQNLGDLMEESGIVGHGTLYTFAEASGAYIKEGNNLFTDLARHGHMTTAFAPSAYDFGILGVVLWSVVIFTALWLLYLKSASVYMSTFYAIFCARFALLWTGNFLSLPSLYYYLVVLIVLNLMLSTLRSSRAVSVGQERATIPVNRLPVHKNREVS